MKGFFEQYGKVIVTAVIAISLISVTLALKPVVQNNLNNMVNDMSDELSSSIVISDVNVGGEDTGSGGSGGSGSGGGSEPPVTPDPAPVTQTITAGTYTFKDILSLPSETITQDGLNITFTGIDDGEYIEKIQVLSSNMNYTTQTGMGFYVAYNSSAGWSASRPGVKEITLTSDAAVSQEFYDWFDNNIIKIFYFSIGTASPTIYQAEEGMTWEEWVNSSYNTDGYFISPTYNGGSDMRIWSDLDIGSMGAYVSKLSAEFPESPTDVIIPGQYYWDATWCD